MARRTELDPEMQNHFYDDGRLYHPLIIELRAGQVDAAEINELYRRKKEYVAKAERGEDCWQYIHRFNLT